MDTKDKAKEKTVKAIQGGTDIATGFFGGLMEFKFFRSLWSLVKIGIILFIIIIALEIVFNKNII